MAKYRWYRCPECGGTFRFLHHPSDSPPPDRCELCYVWMRDDVPAPVFVPQSPGIRKSPYVKSVDQVYRRMEEASIGRAAEASDAAYDAARAAGMTDAQIRDTKIADMSSIKITNMRDPSEMREGDIAAIPTPSPVQQSLAQLAAAGGGGGFNPLAVNGNVVPGPLLAAAAHTGDHPHAGESVRSATVSSHRDRAYAMQRAGEMGRYGGRG